MSKTMKRVSALLLAILMIVTYMPMMQETAYAAKAKKPAKVKGLKATVKKGTKKIALSWKKAKNAKKYLVTIKDNSTKLSATKTSKKTKLTITGQWNTKYTIKVQGVNGKKKGSAAKKTAKIGADPKATKASQDLAAAQKKLEEAEAELKKKEADAQATETELSTAEANVETLAEQVDKFDAQVRALAANATRLGDVADTWNPEVKEALNAMIAKYDGDDAGNKNRYVVFDFDNTCSIFDVEEQLAVYQLQVMAFAESVNASKLADILATGLKKEYFKSPAPASADYCANADATYQDWIDDITAAYQKLIDKGYKFTPAGLSEADQARIQADDDWKEFATKMRAMYDCVFDSESADVAYPWVLYWFTGMTHDQVYDLATASHTKYKKVATTTETWETAGKGSKLGACDYTWTSGTAVSVNIVELMSALKKAGINVWVCSASATDPIRAAIDVFGMHDVVSGMMAMTNKYDEVFDNAYDYKTGYAWMPQSGDRWVEATTLNATKAQTQGKGKVTAIQNVLGPVYGNHGPIAGFMDSTGDFNFCTEFEDLEVVLCFNRASRKVTDGGGLCAEMAVYEAGNGMTYSTRGDDTLYLLQGRDETGLRGLRPARETIRVTSGGPQEPKLFANGDNQAQLDYITTNKMTVKAAMDKFAIKTAAGAAGNPFTFKYGFISGRYSGYHSQTGTATDALKKSLAHTDWNTEVKEALNDMMVAEQDNGQYAVFDFDNTCSIYDVEEQLAIHQLKVMAFAETMTVDKLREVLATGLNEEYFTKPAPASKDYCANKDATYQDWIDDIAAAYDKLLKSSYATEGHFTPAGLSENDSAAIQLNLDWKEFASKMRAMYDCVFDSESADVAYPWVLYWFTGMTHEQVYNLARASHAKYKAERTSYETLESDGIDSNGNASKIGKCSNKYSVGTAVSNNIVELMEALDANGIDVWVCSASATDPIRAAIDEFGLHDYVTGMLAMTNVYKDDAYDNEYDYKTGYACIPKETSADPTHADWEYGDKATKAQTQGKGKVTAVQNVCVPEYGHGPIAGFMDSTGDFNFCTEFETLQVVCCFNRASRKVTDGGGLCAEVAVYEADTLGYNYAAAKANSDTLYVLQGRDERQTRSLRPYRETIRVTSDGTQAPKLFANPDNQTQLDYFINKKMSVEDIMNTFSLKTDGGVPGNPFTFKYGFLKTYDGYHSQE